MTTILHYHDATGDVRGWLAYDGHQAPLAAGGCRVRAGTTAADLAALAERMSLKQALLGTNVDGAKCGIDLDPGTDTKAAALAGFLGFLRDELRSRFSMGSDMGTDWAELRRLCTQIGVASPKYAIRGAQGLTDAQFAARIGLLEQPAGALTFGQRRAGHALAHAAIGAARTIGVTGTIRYALQGFGTLARAAAHTLAEEGTSLVACADEHGCVCAGDGLDVASMLRAPNRTPVPRLPSGGTRAPGGTLFGADADVLILAAQSDAMGPAEIDDASCGAVVVGANLGLSDTAEDALHQRGVFVVPDVVGGIGGSASMEVLFGAPRPPTLNQAMGDLADLTRGLVADLAATAARYGERPRQAIQRLVMDHHCDPTSRPYGHCRYLPARTN